MSQDARRKLTVTLGRRPGWRAAEYSLLLAALRWLIEAGAEESNILAAMQGEVFARGGDCAGDLRRPFDVHDVQANAELDVVSNWKVEFGDFPPKPDGDVVVFVLPHRDGFVEEVGDPEQVVSYPPLVFPHLPLKLADHPADLLGPADELLNILPPPLPLRDLGGDHPPLVSELI